MKSLGRTRLVCVAAAVALAAPAVAVAAAGSQMYEMLGSVGGYRIGLNAVVAPDHKTLVSTHYFYAGKLADIALRAEPATNGVTLREPGSGVFDLHFVGNGSEHGAPLDFYNSVGLAGTWSQGGRTLPVKLQFDTVRDPPAPGGWYALIGTAPDAAVEANARRFLQGVADGDRSAAASAVSYPLTVNRAHGALRIRAKAALLAHWDAIFTPAYVATLKTAVPHEMFVNYRGAMVAGGAAWFDDKGATALNVGT